ncbi:unnamed protein product [Caretta caretta]
MSAASRVSVAPPELQVGGPETGGGSGQARSQELGETGQELPEPSQVLPEVDEAGESSGSREADPPGQDEKQRQWQVVEAPLPKENPWTRRKPVPRSPSPAAADTQLVLQDSERPSSTKVIKAGKPKTRKPSKRPLFT